METKWISVKETLPPHSKGVQSHDVLIWGSIYVDGKYSHSGWTVGWIDMCGNWAWVFPERAEVKKISHWAIPKKPK